MSTQAAEQHKQAAEQYGHAARHYKEAAEHHKMGHYAKAVSYGRPRVGIMNRLRIMRP